MRRWIFYRVSSRLCIWVILIYGTSFSAFAESSDKVSSALARAGFENIRVLQEDSIVYISYENTIYRWNVKGISIALDSIAAHTAPESKLQVLLLNMGVPQVEIITRASEWLNFRAKKTLKTDYNQQIHISYNTNPTWKKLNTQASINPSYGKVDLVFYTQVKLVNTYYDQLFDSQVNIAPALEISLWKGAKGTLQWLFPIINSTRVFGEKGKYVRPGFATISQQFQIHPRLYTNLTAGLFNFDRSGIDWETEYNLSQSVSLRTEMAYTGIFNVGGQLPQDWNFGTWDRLTWSVGGSYYNKQFSVLTSGYVQRFLGGDTGFRMDLTRMFGEVSVGFYGLITKDKKDAGFHVAIPLPGSRRPRWNRFRVMLPRYFDWEYAVSNNNNSGSSFETRPNENRVEHFFNPDYLKSQLLSN